MRSVETGAGSGMCVDAINHGGRGSAAVINRQGKQPVRGVATYRTTRNAPRGRVDPQVEIRLHVGVGDYGR